MMKKIGERIKDTRKKCNLTQQELGQSVGLDKSTIQRYESGQIAKIKEPVIAAIAKRLSVNPDWLMLRSEIQSPLPDAPELIPYHAEVHKIPILGVISAGLPIFAEQNIEGYTYTDRNGGAEYFALRVRGDSMNAARIHNGDILIVRRQEEVENGEIAVVLVNNENATVKRFKKCGNTVQLIPQSFNPEHQIQIYDLKNDKISIVGKVVECKVIL